MHGSEISPTASTSPSTLTFGHKIGAEPPSQSDDDGCCIEPADVREGEELHLEVRNIN